MLQRMQVSVGDGMPSTPGWEPGQLDRLTDWAVNEEANRPIICEYKPDAFWLWSRYRGTVLSLTVGPVALTMLLSVGVDLYSHQHAAASWPLHVLPPREENLIQGLLAVNKLWEYQLTLATFILTFFTSQAYTYWRNVYFCARAIQGRINDICMLLTMGAARTHHTVDGGGGGVVGEGPGGGLNASSYTGEARSMVRRCTRLIRMSHVRCVRARADCRAFAAGAACG